ncbi:M16 family metallopeptidase [Longispora urticae]
MIHETEVDGVPTLLAPTSGPMRAGLLFRVGTADETLARSGVTHLVEHLALHRHGQTDYHFNGTTSTVVTHFHMHGSESDIVAYLTGVCESLTDLPVERLETEKAILRTEAAGRTSAANESMGLWRYGARDFGLGSYQELGLHALGPDDVREWADTWFTRENAVLWIAGDAVPPGLKLRLRDGTRRPPPAASEVLPHTPAYFAGPDNLVVFDAVVPRSTAASVYAGVLERELYRSLRQEGGYSYTASASCDPRGDGLSVVTAVADALPAQQDAMLGGFLDVLWKLKVGRIEDEDLAVTRTRAEELFQHPDSVRLPAHAWNLITGQSNHTTEELRAELRAVTVADVHAVAEQAMGSGLIMVPGGRGADTAGFTEAPRHSTAAVTGVAHRSRGASKARLVLGPEGVSVVDQGATATVRYDECAALLTYPDGARRLLGHDGVGVAIEPTLFRVPRGAVDAVDAAVPPGVVVRMPARTAQNIPRAPRRRPKPLRAMSTAEALFFLALVLGSGFCGLLTLVAAGTLMQDGSTFENWSFLVVMGGLTLGMIHRCFLLYRTG